MSFLAENLRGELSGLSPKAPTTRGNLELCLLQLRLGGSLERVQLRA